MNWLAEEFLALESSKEAQLSFLWHTFLFTRSCLDSVTKDLETNRLQHFAEMAGVRKSLEQIKIYTEQKDILAQEIQDENEQLRKQLLHLLSLQEMVELRKAKELNDRLDLEIRALRNRVRSLDAEKNSLKKTVESQQEEIQRLKSALQRQQQSLTGEVQADQENCKECPGCLKARNALLCDQDEHENLQREICEALNCVDEERSKYHNMKDKFMEKLCRAKQKLDEETVWRDKRISNLERELSLCYHSMKKEKEVVKCITMENEKLLSERRKLLQQLSEEEDNKKNLKLTASLTKTRVEYLETENKNLGNKMLQMSNLIATLERRLQNMQCLHFTEELQKMSTQQHTFTPPLTTRLLHEAQDSLDRPYYSDTKQADLTTSLGCIASPTLSRTAEVGYLNLSSTQRASEKSKLQSAFRTSENETS